MVRKTVFRLACLVLFCTTLNAGFAQSIVWADTVIRFSSQKSEKLFAAAQALGAPNKYPNPSYSTCSWSPEYSDARDSEFIQVGFTKPIVAKQVYIAENSNAGHIKSVYITTATAKRKLIYKETNTAETLAGRMLVIQMTSNTDPVERIELVMQKPTLANTYQIDAIGVSVSNDRKLPGIHLSDQPWPEKAEMMGPEINSEFDEVYPIVSPDGQTLFFDRKLHPQNYGNEHADDIWMSSFKNGKWQAAEHPGAPLNNDNHNFLCSISPDGNTALVGNNYTDLSAPSGGVSFTYRAGNGWSAPKKLEIDAFVNVNPYNEFSLAAGGNILVMSIENGSGNGLLDLFVSFRTANGTFSKPVNLGKEINTAGNEMSPFIAADGKTLYFSSNGYPGYGNQDIYMSKRLDDTWQHWSQPMNLGPEVNTPEWDVYFSIDAKGDYGYYSSSRSAVTNLDIFRIKMPPELQPENVLWLKGIVRDKFSAAPINGNIIYTVETATGAGSSDNAGAYALILPQPGAYRIQVTAPGYLTADTLIDLQQLATFKEAYQNFELIPKKAGLVIQMQNILFEVNSNTLQDTSYAELDRIARFLDINPGISIEVRGHSNGLCADTYCDRLSTKRAETVANYFIGKGIESSRISFKGYGKTMPIADNNTPEGRQANQRVEFMITKVE